jgi:hypothetical protein
MVWRELVVQVVEVEGVHYSMQITLQVLTVEMVVTPVVAVVVEDVVRVPVQEEEVVMVVQE